MPRLLDFDHRPVADKIVAGKLWQTNIIKITQEILGKMNKRERQETPRTQKSKEINGE